MSEKTALELVREVKDMVESRLGHGREFPFDGVRTEEGHAWYAKLAEAERLIAANEAEWEKAHEVFNGRVSLRAAVEEIERDGYASLAKKVMATFPFDDVALVSRLPWNRVHGYNYRDGAEMKKEADRLLESLLSDKRAQSVECGRLRWEIRDEGIHLMYLIEFDAWL